MRFGELISENRTKVKIALTFFQIVDKIGQTYHVQYPEAVRVLLDAIPFSLSGILKLLFGWLPIFQGVCLGLSSLPERLIAWIVGPVAVTLALVLIVKLRGHSAVQAVHLILGWFFLVYPIVTSLGFSAIGECECFENVAPGGDGTNRTCFLRADYNEECYLDSFLRTAITRIRPPCQAASGLKSLYPL